MSGRKRVVLHGYLKSLYDGPAEFVVESAAEAIEAFCKQTGALNPKLGKPRHQLRAVGFETAEALYAPTDTEEIHLVPDYAVGKSGLMQILVGAAL
jgi:predicted phage tail protein